jgi:glycosyltransferase involved in cell wall biosynthesis
MLSLNTARLISGKSTVIPDKAKMKILELCLSTGYGGLELYAFRAAQALDKNHDILAVLNNNSKLAEHFGNNSNIKTEFLKRSRSFLPLLNARRLARLVDDYRIDVIHMHHGKDLALAAFAKYFSKSKPSIVYTRQMQITRSKDDFYYNFLYKQMDLMLTITKRLEADAKKFICRYPEKIKTLYYGVSAPEHFLSNDERTRQREEAGFKEDDFIVGLIGRLEESKGQHLLISAVAGAKKKGSNIKALIVGHEMNPGYRNTLKQLAADKDIAENIVFMDFVPDPQRLMQLCDCIVLATYEETFGLVLPEAMRAGVAVIGSNSGGVPEIIKHGETGLLFDSGDANSLCEQIMLLATDPEIRSKIATNGRTDADSRFNTDDHFSQLQQLIISVTDRPKTG